MLNYLVRRGLLGIVALVLISVIVFGLIRSMPGTPLTNEMAEGDPSRTPSKEDYDRMREIYGLDKPWPLSYVKWLGNVAHLNMGQSITHKQPVTKLIIQRVPATLIISVTSLLFAYLLSIPMGLFATVRGGHLDERVMSTSLYMLYSFPAFVAALFLQMLF